MGRTSQDPPFRICDVHDIHCVSGLRPLRSIVFRVEMVNLCPGLELHGKRLISSRFAVAIGYMLVSLSPVIYSHANLICAGDAEERAFIISAMLATGTAFNAWVPLFVWPTVQAPRFFKGYVFTCVLQPVYFLMSVFVFLFSRRFAPKKVKAAHEASI